MYFRKFHHRLAAIATGLAFMACAGWANADPPSRAARLAYTAGAVSFSPAGENEWVQATRNRPLTNGDRLWADADARVEIEVGGATFRLDGNTSVSVLNVDDRMAQLQLTQGTLNLRVRRLATDQVFEIDTPNLAFTVREAGDYRITVDPQGDATDVVVRRGRAEVHGDGTAYTVDARQPYRFTGTGLGDYQNLAVPAPDAFDRWVGERERGYASSLSARYVSRDVVGYQELDNNGTWRVDVSFGNVWVPNRVAAGWTPYRDGHWAWVDPWGWTWIDDAPWGYAVSHYGRWANIRGTWGWVPGPVRARAYYAPALVAFVGGDNFRLTISSGNVGGVAWFPLAPREVYRPSYNASRGYIENVNRSNTVVNNTVVNNTVINNTVINTNTNVTNVVYANRQVPGAVVAVPTAAFVQAQPVSKVAVRVSHEVLAAAPVAVVAPVVPTERSVRGSADAGRKPPARVFERQVVARTAPPVAHAGLAAQQEQLAKHPGKPLDEAARKALPVVVPTVAAAAVGTPAAAATTTPAAPVPAVKVVGQASAKSPVAPPPATVATATAVAVPAARPTPPAALPPPPGPAATPAPPVVGAAPATAPPAVAQPPQQRGKSGQRDAAEPRVAAVPSALPSAAAPAVASKAPVAVVPAPAVVPAAAPVPVPATASAPPVVSAAPATTPPAVAQPPQQRGKSGQRDAAEPGAAAVPIAASPPPAPVAATKAPVAVAPAPAVVPVAVPMPPAVAQPPQQRGKSGQRDAAEPVAAAVPIAARPPPAPAPTMKAPAAAAAVAFAPAAVAPPPRAAPAQPAPPPAQPPVAQAAPAQPPVAAAPRPPRPAASAPSPADSRAKKPRPGASQANNGGADAPQKGDGTARK